MNYKGLPLWFHDPKECLCLFSCSSSCFVLRHNGPVFLTDSCFPGSHKLSQKRFSEKPEEPHAAAYFSLEVTLKKVKENMNIVISLIKSTPLFQASPSSHHFETQ